MLKRTTITLTLIATIGSVNAMNVLREANLTPLGEPAHQVTVTEYNYRTVYAAYPKDSLNTLDNTKQYLQPLAALSTTSLLYAGFKTVSTVLTNSLNYFTAARSKILTSEAIGYGFLTVLSYAIARMAWDAYDESHNLFGRVIRSPNTRDSLFASNILQSYIPENNAEIVAINAQNPNLVWFRVSHAKIEPYAQAPFIPEPIENAPQAAAPQPAAQQDLECALCLENIDRSANRHNMALPCGHLFHEACIRPALAQNRQCPICDTPVDDKDNNG
jgi:hypothetical protein